MIVYMGYGVWMVHTSKCLLAACDNNSSDILVCLVVVQSIVKLCNQGGGQGVEGLGTVQCDYNSTTSAFGHVIEVQLIPMVSYIA